MKKMVLFMSILSIPIIYGQKSTNPRVQSITTSLQNSLRQLSLRFNPSLAQSIQKTIDLLSIYEPDSAQEFQQRLSELERELHQSSRSPLAPNQYSISPEPEPITIPRPTKPTSVPLPVDAPPKLPTTTLPPSDAPTPPAPSYAPPAQPAPSAQPVPSQKPPIESSRPLPVPGELEMLKKQFKTTEQHVINLLGEYIPSIAGKPSAEIKRLTVDTLKQSIRHLSVKNGLIRSNTSAIRSGRETEIGGSQLPSIENMINQFSSFDTAINFFSILYGNEAAQPLRSYRAEIQQDFVAVIVNNAITRAKKIEETLAIFDTSAAAFETEFIHNTLSNILLVTRMLVSLEELSIVYISRYLIEDSASLDTIQNQLQEHLEMIFAQCKQMLDQIKNAFESNANASSFELTLLQRHCYETVGLNTQLISRMLIDPLSMDESAMLHDMIKNTLARMTTKILELKVSSKK